VGLAISALRRSPEACVPPAGHSRLLMGPRSGSAQPYRPTSAARMAPLRRSVKDRASGGGVDVRRGAHVGEGYVAASVPTVGVTTVPAGALDEQLAGIAADIALQLVIVHHGVHRNRLTD